ncbi:MAG: alpha/beta hydrolase [Deltaproteobacteria bacterium]|jgi:esterase|nr:alpha/beta hydrolase [Deltaproteobacteria bacterium]
MSFLQNINYRLTGKEDSPKIVFLHGLMGFLNNWGRITKDLNSKYHCLVFDQRGHGKSFKPDSGYQPENYASDLLQILDELGWEKIILVGHSMGGRNALCFANRHPERIEKLVIVDISPESHKAVGRYFQTMLDAIPTPFRSLENAKSFFQQDFSQLIKINEDLKMLVPFLMANLEIKPEGVVDWKFSKKAILESAQFAPTEGIWSWFSQLTMPCLFVRGAKSKDLSQDIFKKVIESNKNIIGVEVSDAGHWVHSEQPELFLNELKNFIGYNTY